MPSRISSATARMLCKTTLPQPNLGFRACGYPHENAKVYMGGVKVYMGDVYFGHCKGRYLWVVWTDGAIKTNAMLRRRVAVLLVSP